MTDAEVKARIRELRSLRFQSERVVREGVAVREGDLGLPAEVGAADRSEPRRGGKPARTASECVSREGATRERAKRASVGAANTMSDPRHGRERYVSCSFSGCHSQLIRRDILEKCFG